MSGPCPLCGKHSLFELRGLLADAAGTLLGAAEALQQQGYSETAATFRSKGIECAEMAGCNQQTIDQYRGQATQ